MALGLAAGCAGGLPRWAPPGSYSREVVLAAPQEAVFAATLKAFQEAGLEVLIEDREGGRVESSRTSELRYPTTGELVVPPGELHPEDTAITYYDQVSTWEVRAALEPTEVGQTRLRLSILQERQFGWGRVVIEEPDPRIFDSFFSYIGQNAVPVAAAEVTPPAAAEAAPPKVPSPAAEPAPAPPVPAPAEAAVPWLGLVVKEVSPELAAMIETAPGVLVVEAVAGGPAAQAGIRSGDVITAVAGQPVDSPSSLEKALTGLRPGSEVEVGLLRDGRSLSVILKPTRPREYHFF